MFWATWVNFLLGIWLIIAPFVLGYHASHRAATDDLIFGILIAAFSLWRAVRTAAPSYAGWLVFVFGIWVLISPFALRYHDISRVRPNDMIVGTVVLILALLQTIGHHEPKQQAA